MISRSLSTAGFFSSFSKPSSPSPTSSVSRKGSTANPGVNAVMLFSHGPDAGRQWGASMTSLHFPDPKTRKFGYKYGPEHGSKWEGDNMVHKSYYYGIKHIDFVVPKFDPNARSADRCSIDQPLPVLDHAVTLDELPAGYVPPQLDE